MNTNLSLYHLIELPDPSYPLFQLKAGGNVRSAAWNDSEHFLRNVAAFEPGQVSVSIRFVFEPAAAGDKLQQRLSILLAGQAHHEDAAPGLNLLMERGPFHRFFRLQPLKTSPIKWKRFQAACDVVRFRSILDATVPSDLNVNALPAYFLINDFKPDPDNDYLVLDNVLDRVQEPAVIEICVEPVDIRGLLTAHTRYLFLLQQVNRTWDPDDEEAFPRTLGRGRGDWNASLKPLRQKEPLVDDILRRQRRIHENLTRPHLRFHIRVLAETPAVARLLASVVAESAFKDGTYQLLDSARGNPHFNRVVKNANPVEVRPADSLLHLPETQALDIYDSLSCLSCVAPVDQLTGAFRLPVASYGSPRCIRKNTDPPHQTPEDMIVLGYDEQFMEEGSSTISRGVPRGILEKNLVKHAFISGKTGSGKTVSVINVLLQLGALDVPFIVFEPAKSEYRRLKCLKNHPDPQIRRFSENLQLYTPGNEISPLRLNPLYHPPAISHNEHIEHLLNCLQAVIPMEGSMLGIIGEGLERVYQDYEDTGIPPRMVDLYAAVLRVLDSNRYSRDVDSNLRAAFAFRLGVLVLRIIGLVFQCNQNIPTLDRLMTGQSIIELDSLPPEQASLFTLFFLTALREQIKTIPGPNRVPRLVLVLEEAHNIAGRNTDARASETNADPRAFASEFICRMLAELRSQGVAIVIVDQNPTSVASEVIKNTTSLLVFLQTEKDNREIVGGSMLFGPVEKEEIARLRPGEAFIFTEGQFGPRRIRTPNIESELGLPPPPLGESILPHIQEDAWYLEAAAVRTKVEWDQFIPELAQFDETVRDSIARLKQMIQERVRILEKIPEKHRATVLTNLGGRAQTLREHLEAELRRFRWDVYQRWIEGRPKVEIGKASLQAMCDHSVKRVESVLFPGVQACLDKLSSLIQQCGKLPSKQ